MIGPVSRPASGPFFRPASQAVQSSGWLALRKLGLMAAVVAAVFCAVTVQAKGPVEGFATVALSTLPTEALRTHRLILSGGPFSSFKDGAVFGNFERRLPRRERGFYREYTVPTPGSRDRGARRIVCGGSRPTNPENCFYTADHYASFKLIAR